MNTCTRSIEIMAQAFALRKDIGYLCTTLYNEQLASEEKYNMCLIGIEHALNTFDPLRGATFKTHAINCMRNALHRGFRDLYPEKHNGIHDTVVFTDKELDQEAEDEDTPLIMAIREEQRAAIKASLAYLSEREMFIFSHAFGLFGLDELSVTEIAELLDVSKQTISETIQKILKELHPKLQQWKDAL